MPWQITALDERGEPTDTPAFYQHEARDGFRTRNIWIAATERLKLDSREYPLHLLEHESQLSESMDGLPWSDPIQSWGQKLNNSEFQTSDFGDVKFDGRSILWTRNEGGPYLVTHAPTFAIVALTQKISSLKVKWTPLPHELPERMPFPKSPFRPAVFFDARMYSGPHSSIRDSFTKAWLATKQTMYGAKVYVGNKLGYVSIKACLHMGAANAALPTDPSQIARLQRLQRDYPQHAQRIPDLAQSTTVPQTPLVVFVHGTASCGLVNLAQIDLSKLTSNNNWYRYEHDTFLDLSANATELAEKVKNRYPKGPLLLVGHSRGGLVARAAATLLSARDVHVWTFGTPHLGTPLIQAVEGARKIVRTVFGVGIKFGFSLPFVPDWGLNLLTRLGSRIANGVPVADVETAAWAFFLADSQLPPGFSELRPGSGWLNAFNMVDSIDRRSASSSGWQVGTNFLRMYAGEFDASTSKKAGYSVHTGAAKALFSQFDTNDLVVSTESATWRKGIQILRDTTHFDFLSDAGVQSALRGF